MSRPRRRRRSRQTQPTVSPADALWAEKDEPPQPAQPLRPTPDPAALPRSLGDLPLAPETAADLHLAAVYEEAVRTATALAAANGLLRDDGPPTTDED